MAKLTSEEYTAALKPLRREWSDAARWVSETGRRIVIVMEGRDTAGKGGTIDMLREPLNPRQYQVAALPTPTKREQTQWYFQRYVPHLPGAGEITFFDRSWYNRAGVEPMMGFCTPEQTKAFLDAAPIFERQLVDDGILLFKYWLGCGQDKQEERFAKRLNDPMKRWKLSPIDLAARTKYAEYTDARERMLKATHNKHTPWTLVDFTNQARGRLTLLRDLLDRLPDTELPLAPIEWPPLAAPPLEEQYGVLKPIESIDLPGWDDGKKKKKGKKHKKDKDAGDGAATDAASGGEAPSEAAHDD